MNKSKLTLIIDGNWLLMSRLPVLQGKYADQADLMKDVKLLMIKSVNVVLKTFQDIDNIIFVADGGSWRNNVPIPEFLKSRTEEVEYKGNREKSKDLDWDLIFSEYNSMIDLIRDCGINVYAEHEIEGDDWCWYLSTELNKLGTNVIIWSQDRDLTQLVNINEDGVFTIIWDRLHGITAKKEEDITNWLLNPRYHANEQFLQKVINDAGKFKLINPEYVKIDKIFRGDIGDNIFPVLTRTSKSGSTNKNYKILEKDLPEHLKFDDEDEVVDYLELLISIPRYSGKILQTEEQILEHVKYNRKLVVLDEKSYPDYILENMHKHDSELSNIVPIDSMNKVESLLLAEKNSVMSILDEI